jgi:hypothetical protein
MKTDQDRAGTLVDHIVGTLGGLFHGGRGLQVKHLQTFSLRLIKFSKEWGKYFLEKLPILEKHSYSKGKNPIGDISLTVLLSYENQRGQMVYPATKSMQ